MCFLSHDMVADLYCNHQTKIMKPILKHTLYTVYTCAIICCVAIISIKTVKNYDTCVAFMANNTVGKSIPLGK